jgi:hypothetical protein
MTLTSVTHVTEYHPIACISFNDETRIHYVDAPTAAWSLCGDHADGQGLAAVRHAIGW